MREAIENMRALATAHHEGQFRKDGKTPYIEHPRAVVSLLTNWGYGTGDRMWTLAVAWGHDLLEDTDCTEEEIRDACGEIGGQVLDAIRLLSRDKAVFPVKDAYIRNVAEKASAPVLAVKIADRLRNTRDFLALGRKEKARAYFLEGTPLYESPLLTDGNIRRSIDHVRVLVQ